MARLGHSPTSSSRALHRAGCSRERSLRASLRVDLRACICRASRSVDCAEGSESCRAPRRDPRANRLDGFRLARDRVSSVEELRTCAEDAASHRACDRSPHLAGEYGYDASECAEQRSLGAPATGTVPAGDKVESVEIDDMMSGCFVPHEFPFVASPAARGMPMLMEADFRDLRAPGR
jgi:hypothetical protein